MGLLDHKNFNVFSFDFFEKTFEIRSPLFWLMHSLYWFAFALTSYLTLNLWYGTGDISDLAHTLLQSIIGFVLVLPLHRLYTAIWYSSKNIRLIIIITTVILFSAFWTLLRMQLFISMTDANSDLWFDAGGWYFSSIFVFLGWTILYHFVFYYNLANKEVLKNIAASAQTKVEKIKRVEAEKQATDVRLQMLRYQLNPHFLFNTLNSINALITVKETHNAKLMLENLSNFLRYSLEEDTNDSVYLSREMEGLKLYIDIEKIRFSDRLNVILDINKEALSIKVPCMILQPIVENVFKYSVAQTESNALLCISANIENNYLKLCVFDNGPGINELKKKSNTFNLFAGVGLKNTESRLKNIYGNDYHVSLSNRVSGGLKVEILLPIAGL